MTTQHTMQTLTYAELYNTTKEERATWSDAKINQWLSQRIANRKRNLSAICENYAQGIENRKSLLNHN